MKNPAFALFQKDDPIIEAYKKIRTNLIFMNLDSDVKSIVITSPSPGEGKSTTAYNLAAVLVQAGNRTVLVDADLRKPMMHKFFNVPNQPGLTNLLTENLDINEVMRDIILPGGASLKIITGGTIISNPSELLGSEAMFEFMGKMEKTSDIVIFDTPPALTVTDASIISGMANGTILVVERGKTSMESLRVTIDILNSVKSNILGTVLNKSSRKKLKRYYRYSTHKA